MILERIDDLAHGYYMANLRKPNTVRVSVPVWGVIEYEMKDRMMMLAQEQIKSDFNASWATFINTSVGTLRVYVVDRMDDLLEVTREWDPAHHETERSIAYGLNTDV